MSEEKKPHNAAENPKRESVIPNGYFINVDKDRKTMIIQIPLKDIADQGSDMMVIATMKGFFQIMQERAENIINWHMMNAAKNPKIIVPGQNGSGVDLKVS